MITENTLNTNTGGIINQAALLGSVDPEKYMRRWQREHRKGGGYEMQMSPHDIAALVNHARPYLKGHRMLCVGAETMGAERFIAEHLGMMAVDVMPVSPDENKNVNAMRDDKIEVHGVSHPTGIYDLIVLFGDNDFDIKALGAYTKINTLIAVLATNIRSGMPGLRQAWFELRRLHYPILQNTDTFDMGVGMAKVTFKEESHDHKRPVFTHRQNGGVSEHGTSAQGSEDHQGGGALEAGNPGLEAEEAGRLPPESAPIQEGRFEDSQAEIVAYDEVFPETAARIALDNRNLAPQAEEVAAPWGRKKDGAPKKRPGRAAA